MTFKTIWDDKLDIELGTADQTQFFTAVRRKQAANEAQDAFVRDTGCTKRYANLSITNGVAEYDLEALIADYIRLLGDPSIKIVSGTSVTYIQGPDAFPRRDPEVLDRINPGWRGASDGTPTVWYLKDDGGAENIGLNPGPAVAAGETWTLIVPYLADPTDMAADGDLPFTINGNARANLAHYHQALAHYAAAQLEPLRKNYSGVQRQQQLYAGYVARYLQTNSQNDSNQITLMRDYLGETVRVTRDLDPRR